MAPGDQQGTRHSGLHCDARHHPRRTLQSATEYSCPASRSIWIWRSKSGNVRATNFASVEKVRVKIATSRRKLAAHLSSCHLKLLGIGFCHVNTPQGRRRPLSHL